MVIDGLDNGAFAQEDFIFQEHETVFHVFAQFGNELKGLLAEKLVKKGLRQIAFVATEFAEKRFGKVWNWKTVIDSARREAAGQQFAAIIGNHMQFEAYNQPSEFLPR